MPNLAPISLLNELDVGVGRKSKGNLSAFIVTENESQDQLLPEITPFTNNIKHLHSMTELVKFPLSIVYNGRPVYALRDPDAKKD